MWYKSTNEKGMKTLDRRSDSGADKWELYVVDFSLTVGVPKSTKAAVLPQSWKQNTRMIKHKRD